MASNVLADLLSGSASIFTQHNRLLRLRFARGSGIPGDALLPHTLKGEEGLSRCYCYELECLSPDVHLELKDLLGQAVEIAILLPDGGERLLTGLLTRTRQLGAQGGFARYGLTIEPALATLAHRQNSRVFQDKSAVEIVQSILDEHLAGNPAFAGSFQHHSLLNGSYPQRSYCVQYRESDLAFIERLLAEEGISYRFTHGRDTDSSLRQHALGRLGEAATEAPLHTLILLNADHPHPPAGALPIRFHRTAGVEATDAIDGWEGSRQLQSASSSLATYDYKSGSVSHGSESTRIAQGDAGDQLASTLNDYDPQTLYYGSTPEHVAHYAKLHQQRRDLASKTFAGTGSARHLQVGTWFQLANHPIHDQDRPDDRQFLVTDLHFEARNNFTTEAQQVLGALFSAAPPHAESRPPYRNSFTATRRHVPVVPEYSRTRHQKPSAPGSTTAAVVGPAGEEVFTDEFGRIKIQFHWQRRESHPEGGADGDDRSSTWVRVAYPSAGAQWGSQYIPRVGQEVVVDFLEHDIDRPIVIGVVHNGNQRPPHFSNAGQLPANKALSGIKSKEFKGGGYNELLFDDTTGQVRARLSSEHAKTQLNQGYLVHPRTEGEGKPRGDGFELRSDAAGAIRAAKALLLTAEPQPEAAGKQLARDALLATLDAALTLVEQLGDVAKTQHANLPETGKGNELVEGENQSGPTQDVGHQTHLKQALENLERGSNTDKEGTSGSGQQPGGQSVIALSALAGLAISTPNSATIATGTNLDQVAMRDTNQTTGRRWIHNVTESISLFVMGKTAKVKDTFKLIAAKGNILMQAQEGKIRATAQQDFTISSVNGKVIVSAPQEILLAAGGGYIRVGANIEIHNPGAQSQKAASFALSGPTSLSVEAQKFPASNVDFDQEFILAMHNGEPAPNRKFIIQFDDGGKLKGQSDSNGRTGIKQSALSARHRITILPSEGA